MDFTESFEKFENRLDAFLRSGFGTWASQYLPLVLGAGMLVLLLLTQLGLNVASGAISVLQNTYSKITTAEPTATNSNTAVISNTQDLNRSKQVPALQKTEIPEAKNSHSSGFTRVTERTEGEFGRMSELADNQSWAGDFINRWNAKYSLPKNAEIIFRDCGENEITQWSPDAQKAVICYQFLNDYITVGVDGKYLDTPITQVGLNRYATLIAAQLMAQAFLSQNNLYTGGGKAEQADAIAIYWFRQLYQPKESSDILRGALMGFRQIAISAQSERNQARANQALCFYVGAEPGEAEWMKTDEIFNGDAERCQNEYQNLEKHWNARADQAG